jgi:hypothetical protein
VDLAAGLALSLVFLIFMLLSVGGAVFWIVALVDCIRRSDNVYRMAGTEKVTWVLIVALTGWIGALIYWFSQRARLEQVERAGLADVAPMWVAPYPGYAVPPVGAPASPPGWYPDPQGRGVRWWDGGRWTEHVADRP